MKKFNEFITEEISPIRMDDEERAAYEEGRVDQDFEDRKEESIKRTHFYETEDSDNITWDILEEDMKRDFGEFTNIRTQDFRYVTEWLKNKITDKKILL